MHKLQRKEQAYVVIEVIIQILFFSLFFYKSVLAFFALIPLGIPLIGMKVSDKIRLRKHIITMQFTELLRFIAGSLQAGYSLENSFLLAIDEMKEMFGDDAYIVGELQIIKKGLQNNGSIVYLVEHMGARTEISEIRDFASVIAVGSRYGGNLLDTMHTFVKIVEDKDSVMRELETMISSVKFEQRIMNAIPFVILIYVNTVCKGYFNILYGNIFGCIVMTLCLVLYVTALYLSNRISTFEI